jgi:hypothetical protein
VACLSIIRRPGAATIAGRSELLLIGPCVLHLSLFLHASVINVQTCIFFVLFLEFSFQSSYSIKLVQGQLLTFVEYFVLLYRALLPAPVWSKFFFNKEYGTLFSSVTTLLYLIFKLTSVLEKVKSHQIRGCN